MRPAIAIFVAACASTAPHPPTGGPRGLRASEHLDEAKRHDEQARQRTAWPDRMGSDGQPYIPWVRAWDTGVEHERLASLHRSRASALHAAYDEACGTRSPEEIAISPIQRYATGGWNTTTGVILYLTPTAGGPERLMAELKCHRAWMMLGPAGMDDCPLDLPDLLIDARGDREGITLSIMTRDPDMVGELQRRVAHDLESHARNASPR
jgi:hypothetical protein